MRMIPISYMHNVVELPIPWEQDGGEEGRTSANSWCPLYQILKLWKIPVWQCCQGLGSSTGRA